MLCLLPLCVGCSTLGFCTQPVAHVISDEARCVLEHSSGRPNVPTELNKHLPPGHTLQPGDTILLEILDESSRLRLPADQTVMADGSIDVGEFGRVVVAAMTPEQAEATVQNMIAARGRESVPINVRLVQPVHRFYVIGEVNSPGSYPLAGHETVLDALMKAGGLTDRASGCDILLARPTDPCSCRVTLPICYRAITQLGDTSTNYHLQPGDRILVARQTRCEELFSFFSLSYSCDRCANPVKACCDPGAAASGGSEFVSPGGTVYPAVRPPTIAGQPTQRSPGRGSGVRLLSPQTDIGGPVVPPDPAATPSDVDGELDFGDPPGGFLPPRQR